MGRVPYKYDAGYLDYLSSRIDAMNTAIKTLKSQYTKFPVFDLGLNPPLKPKNGDVCVDYNEDGDPYYYWDGAWWPFTGRPSYEMKLFPDVGAGSTVVTGDNRFVWVVPDDVDGYILYRARSFVTTTGGSTTTVQIRNRQVGDMLSTPLTITSGQRNSWANAYVINPANDQVSAQDEIACDVDAAGSGAKGLGVILQFKKPRPV